MIVAIFHHHYKHLEIIEAVKPDNNNSYALCNLLFSLQNLLIVCMR